MQTHPNAKLTPAGRQAMVAMVVAGATIRTAAAAFSQSVSTTHRWLCRYRDASSAERARGTWSADRSSRPRRSPRLLPSGRQAAIIAARETHSGWGPRLLAGVVGAPHQTIWKVLHRHGRSRLLGPGREPANRYEWPCPGDLLHMDTKRFACFDQPGHARTGDRTRRSDGAGWEYTHSIIDDHTRLAYTELHPDERAATVTAFFARALGFFAAHGITATRVMTDNAYTYTNNRSFKALLAEHEISHRRTRPYRPRTNGKVERYQQTLQREWAYGQTYRSSAARAAALPHWLDHYNTARPHSATNGHPPISRVHNLRRQDS